MRRPHNVVLATLIIFGIVFLLAQKHYDEQEAYQVTESHPSKETVPGKGLAPVTFGQPPAIRPAPQEAPPVFGPLPNPQPGQQNSKPISPPLGPSESKTTFEQNAVAPDYKPDFPFQKDLALEFPSLALKKLSKHRAHNYNPNGPKTYTYATFMATRNPSLKDPYFLAIQSLVYRILWSQRSRSEKYPVVVFVAHYVTAEQRAVLSGAGAIVRELAPLEWNPNKPGVFKHWKDLFAKLNMWNEVEFERILFLDADAFPFANIDEMFTIAPVQECKGEKMTLDDMIPDNVPLCESYIFAGVSADPENFPQSNINVGAMVFTPSVGMYKRLVQNYVKTDKYDCLMAEQAYLDWQFRLDGPFPPSILERKWGGYFPKPDEEGKLNVVHEKLWMFDEGWLKRDWEETWQEMLKFYASPAFQEAREKDGLKEMNF